MMMTLNKVMQFFIWLGYPVVIFFGLEYVDPRTMALALGGLLILRWRKEALAIFEGMAWLPVVCVLLLAATLLAIFITNNESLIRIYPAIINIGMLSIFAYSLMRPPTMIERFAMLHQGRLTTEIIAYTRLVTKVWCMFFLLNGGIAIYTVFFTSRETWAWYNGLVAYLLMGTLFVAEWLIRQQVIKNNLK